MKYVGFLIFFFFFFSLGIFGWTARNLLLHRELERAPNYSIRRCKKTFKTTITATKHGKMFPFVARSPSLFSKTLCMRLMA